MTAVLNSLFIYFFYKKISHAPKVQKAQKAPKAQKVEKVQKTQISE